MHDASRLNDYFEWFFNPPVVVCAVPAVRDRPHVDGPTYSTQSGFCCSEIDGDASEAPQALQ